MRRNLALAGAAAALLLVAGRSRPGLLRVPEGVECAGSLYLQDEYGALLGPGNIAPTECVRGPVQVLTWARICCDGVCGDTAVSGPAASCSRTFDVTGRPL